MPYRHEIHNLRTGQKYAVQTEGPELERWDPVWGSEAHRVPLEKADAWDKANGTPVTVPDPDTGEKREFLDVPKDYELTSEDISAEVAQREAREADFRDKVQRVLAVTDEQIDAAQLPDLRRLLKWHHRILRYLAANE